MAAALRLAVLASGRGTDLQSLLDASADGRIASRVVVVASDVADAKALDRARRAGVAAEAVVPAPKLPPPERKAEQEGHLVQVLETYRVDLVVLAGYMRLLSAAFVRRFPNRIVNIHPALLPSFPGVQAQKQALDWGVGVAGCTTHLVDELTDHGPIVLQAALAVKAGETEEELSRRILAVEHQLLPRTVHLIEQGRVRVEGRRVRVDPDTSWTTKYAVLPGVLYGPGY